MNNVHKTIRDQLSQIEAMTSALRDQLKQAELQETELRVVQESQGLSLYLGAQKIPVSLDVTYEGDQVQLSFSVPVDEIERVATQRFCPVPASITFANELSADDRTMDFHTHKNEAYRLPSDELWEGEFSH